MSELDNLSKREEIEYLELIELEAARESRNSILDFTEFTFDKYKSNWHHEKYGEKIDQFIRGNIKNLMVFMPPQHGKSEISTRRTPAKILGDYPDKKIGIIAYNHTIASKFNRDVQRIIDSHEYHLMYPDTNLNGSNVRTTQNYLRNSDEFEIVGKEGSLVSVGVGGGLTSRKLDIAIMDDLYKDAMDAWSSTKRENVQDWYDTVLKTRLHNGSQQLLVFTRWHEEDLAGHLLRTEPEKWEVVLFEGIRTDIPHSYDPREQGEALWPEQHSLETLEGIKEKNSIVFDSLYQQNPTPKEGLLMSDSEMKKFTMDMISHKENKPDAIVAFGDVADEGTDKLCIPIGYVYGEDTYIVDVLFTIEPVEISQPFAAAILDKHKAEMCTFESNNGGKGYALKVEELKKGRTMIDWRPTTQNKHTKIVMKSGDIKGNMYFRTDIAEHKEYQMYYHELTHYPKNGKVKHDDAADATAMLADMIYSDDEKWGWN